MQALHILLTKRMLNSVYNAEKVGRSFSVLRLSMAVAAAGFELTTIWIQDGRLASTATADLIKKDIFFMAKRIALLFSTK